MVDTSVKLNVPKNYDVKVSRDKVVVRSRDLVEIMQFGIRAIIDKDDIDNWRVHGWQTQEDQKKEAEKKMKKVMEANAV